MKHSGWQYVGIKAINPESTLPYLGRELPALLLGLRSAGPGRPRPCPVIPRAGLQPRPPTEQNRAAGSGLIPVPPPAAALLPPRPRGKHLQCTGVGELTPKAHGRQNSAKWHKAASERCRVDVRKRFFTHRVVGHWDEPPGSQHQA